MTNITSVDTKLAPAVEDPSERNPLELMWKARQTFNWTLDDFAVCFGWEKCTIQRWMYGQKPSRRARIMAALLWERWGLE